MCHLTNYLYRGNIKDSRQSWSKTLSKILSFPALLYGPSAENEGEELILRVVLSETSNNNFHLQSAFSFTKHLLSHLLICFSKQPCKRGTGMSVPIWQMGKLRVRRTNGSWLNSKALSTPPRRFIQRMEVQPRTHTSTSSSIKVKGWIS